MKKRIVQLLFLIMLNSTLTIGQYESVFGSNYTEWNYLELSCDNAIVDTYIHEKDTIINEILYHKINDWGLLRETEINTKLWYRSFDDETEILIMDLSLEIGDTFTIDTTDYVVDTIFTQGSLKIIEFDFTPDECIGFVENLRFEEGRGPNLNLEFAITGDNFDIKLFRCHTKDSVTENFLIEYFSSDCSMDLINTENFEIEKVRVYPNPANDLLTIESLDNSPKSIEIYSINGVKVHSDNTTNIIETINIDHLQTGLYFVLIKDGNYSSSIKILIE